MKVKFLPQNISLDIKPGESVMKLARENKLSISSSCNGMCSCAECRVHIVEGESHLLPPSNKEVELIGGGYFIDNRRLSCQLFCFGDVTIDLSEQVEREKQKGIANKQFLKKISKENEESSSIGGIFVEQEKELNKISASEQESYSFEPLTDTFYKVEPNKEKKWRNKRRSRKNKNRSQGRSKRHGSFS